MVAVKRPFVIITPSILPIGLFLLGLSDSDISIADTGVPKNEVTSGASKASDSSAGAATAITVTGVLHEQPNHRQIQPTQKGPRLVCGFA